MKQTNLIGLVFMIALGTTAGAFISPLFAQQEAPTSPQIPCSVGEGSNAACSGNWIYFAGNTGAIDSGAWVFRMNSETGEVWYKNGKNLVLLEEERD